MQFFQIGKGKTFSVCSNTRNSPIEKFNFTPEAEDTLWLMKGYSMYSNSDSLLLPNSKGMMGYGETRTRGVSRRMSSIPKTLVISANNRF